MRPSVEAQEARVLLSSATTSGINTLVGAAIGGTMLTALPELLRGAAEYKDFLTGFLLLLVLIFLPNGIIGFIRQHFTGVLPAKNGYSVSGQVAQPDVRLSSNQSCASS